MYVYLRVLFEENMAHGQENWKLVTFQTTLFYFMLSGTTEQESDAMQCEMDLRCL